MKDVINIASDYKEALNDLKVMVKLKIFKMMLGLTVMIEYYFMLDLL